MINNKFTVGDPEKDFFEQNPHWRYLDSSIKLLKLVPKDLASKLRWAVFLIEDPDSKYHRYSKLKRVEIVNENYLKGEYVIEYDPNTLTNINEDIKFLFDSYASETMSKIKRDYYERELSYEILVASERDCSDLKIKADYWTDHINKCLQGVWGHEYNEETKEGGYRWMPGNLFFYVNDTIIKMEESESREVICKPKLRDVEWYIFYALTVCDGFSGF